jgi:hypothetical protein
MNNLPPRANARFIGVEWSRSRNGLTTASLETATTTDARK